MHTMVQLDKVYIRLGMIQLWSRRQDIPFETWLDLAPLLLHRPTPKHLQFEAAMARHPSMMPL